MPVLRSLFLLLLLFVPLRAAEAPQTTFLDGCAAYDSGRFAVAKMKFEEILHEGKQVSPGLFYNLGCTEARLENPGRAALNFYRALLLEPNHTEARQNLRYLTKKEGILAFASEGLDLIANRAKLSTWRSIFWASLWAAVIAAAVLIWLRPRLYWPWIVLVCLGGLGTIGGGVGFFVRSKQIPPGQLKVVVATGINAFNAPAESADSVIALSPGSQVQPLEERGQWTYVQVPGAARTRGWIRSNNLEPLWPFAPALAE